MGWCISSCGREDDPRLSPLDDPRSPDELGDVRFQYPPLWPPRDASLPEGGVKGRNPPLLAERLLAEPLLAEDSLRSVVVRDQLLLDSLERAFPLDELNPPRFCAAEG